ncbi:MAG: SHIRT domain-containing protein, partial [Coriobacteriia bacterium]|nr:SHIRT domain-containing protein [Coriobacteriia bacterium]
MEARINQSFQEAYPNVHLSKQRTRKMLKKSVLSLFLSATLLAALMLGMVPGIAVTLESNSDYTVVFKVGDEAVEDDLVLTKVARGTLIEDIAPDLTAEPGNSFVRWTPEWEPTDVVDEDLEFVAKWAKTDEMIVASVLPLESEVSLFSEETTTSVADAVKPATTFLGIAAATEEIGETWTVTFEAGNNSTNNDRVVENVPDGTLVQSIAPTFSPKPGYRFNRWSPTVNATTRVTDDMTYTAQWVIYNDSHNWSSALSVMALQSGWSLPADSVLLEFDNVSLNGQTFLDYVYFSVDNEGNVSLFFLAYSQNKNFIHSASYMSYAGLAGVPVATWTAQTNPFRQYRVFRVVIPASAVAETIIVGSPSLNIVNEGNRPHSIWDMPLRFTNINYVTEHYVYDLDPNGIPNTPVLRATVPGVGFTNQTVTARPITIFGYNYVPGHPDEIISGVIVNPNKIELYLRLYYEKDEHVTWIIRGVYGEESQTVYNGRPQSLSDFLDADEFFVIDWPNRFDEVKTDDYMFIANPNSDKGLGMHLVDPAGINVGTYEQVLELVSGYKILYTNFDENWDPNGYPGTPVTIDGKQWVDITNELGAAVTIHGKLEIIPRPIDISTPSAEKIWDGSALQRPEYTYNESEGTIPDDKVGLLSFLGHEIEITVTGSQTDPGSSQNGYSAIIRDEYGDDVTRDYRFVDDLGILKVTPVIFYHANSFDAIGAMTNTDGFDIGDEVTLSPNQYSRYLHYFNGWNNRADGSGISYSDEETFEYSYSDNLDLYAMWEPNPFYSVSYEVSGSRPATATVSGLPASPQSHQRDALVEVAGYPTSSATDDGSGILGRWIFNGWQTINVPVLMGSFIMPDGPVLFVGSWTFTPNPVHEVSYRVVGTQPTPVSKMPDTPQSYQSEANVTVASVPTTTATINNDNLLGTWTFSGWETDDALVVSGGFVMPEGDVEFTGEWVFTPNEYYHVTYKIEGDAPALVSGMPESPQLHQEEATV